MTENIVATIEARMSSTRFPGKVLSEIIGKPMLELLIERVKQAEMIDDIVVATSKNREDSPIEKLTKRLSVGCYRGSLNDVLGRLLKAAFVFDADIIVKLSGDNPLYDHTLIDAITKYYLENTYDFVSTTAMGFTEKWGEKRTFPVGTGISVFSMELLIEVEKASRHNPYDREHVVSYIIENPEKFSLGAFSATGYLAAYNRPELRLTVDTDADFKLIKTVFENLYFKNPHFTIPEVIEFLDANPYLKEINKHIEQKGLKR